MLSLAGMCVCGSQVWVGQVLSEHVLRECPSSRLQAKEGDRQSSECSFGSIMVLPTR